MADTVLMLPDHISASLLTAARQDVEAAAVLLAGLARTRHGLQLIGRELHWIPDDAYEERTEDRMVIRSSGYVPVLARAEEISAVPVFVHTHPGAFASPRPSQWDDVVDEALAETFRIRSQSDVFASIVVSSAEHQVAFTGRGFDGLSTFQVGSLLISGSRIVIIRAIGAPQAPLPEIFDRQVRAFGEDVQRVLGALRIGIVGCGGTGSAVAEQLVRLGVRHLVLVDKDVLTYTNLTRMYGSTPTDVGLPKAEVLARHLRTIAPNLEVDVHIGFVKSEASTRPLTTCDVLFGCTDDNAGRLIMSRLSSYYLIPLIDSGVLISSDRETIDGIHGRITVQTPGSACLVCRGRIDLARAGAELMNPSERQKLADEGYAPALAGVEPAVVAFTSLVASQAVIELLDLLVGFGPETRPTEVLHRMHDREVSANTRAPGEHHFCHPESKEFGRGDSDPFLGRMWNRT